MDERDLDFPEDADYLPPEFFVEEVEIGSNETCGELFLNSAGEYATCVLHAHPPQTGHCDGTDYCEEYECDDPVADLCRTFGFVDHHGLPTFEFFEHFEAAT